jgi:4'-phosphopantetheinyl transferase
VSGDVVHVWLVRSDLPPAVLAALAAVLDDGERQRAEALALPRHRRQFVAAHGLARVVLGRKLGVSPERIRWRYGRHGKPEPSGAPGVHMSLSHSGQLAALAVTGRRAVGVDVQRLPAGLDVAHLAERFYPATEAQLVAGAATPAEQARRFGWLWVRKEACLKAAGGRLAEGLRLPVHGTGCAVLRDPSGALPGAFRVQDLPTRAGFQAAVALRGAGPYRVVRTWWDGSLDFDPTAVQTCSTATSI